jgi:hypothetical protein
MPVNRDTESWRAGFLAGVSDGPAACPADMPDVPAFADGYAEGQDAHQRRPSLCVIDAAEMPMDLALSLLEPITDPDQIALNALLEDDEPKTTTR